MMKTEVELEIHRLIMNDCGTVVSSKKTWHDGRWIEMSITYEVCGVAYHRPGELLIYVTIKSFKPVDPAISLYELTMFLRDDLKRHFEPLRNTNIEVEVSYYGANKEAIMNHLRGDFLNMCYTAELPLEIVLAMLFRFMEEKVTDTKYQNMRTFLSIYIAKYLGSRTDFDSIDDPEWEAFKMGDYRKIIAIAEEEFRTFSSADEDVSSKIDCLLKIAEARIKLHEYKETEKVLEEAYTLMAILKEIPTDHFLAELIAENIRDQTLEIMKLEYKLEMNRGNSEMGIQLLEKYVNHFKEQKTLIETCGMYYDAHNHAMQMGHQPIAEAYYKMAEMYSEMDRKERNGVLEELEWDERS